MPQVTITIELEALQETMIALRERRYELQEEINTTNSDEILIISNRQLRRVTEAMRALQEQLGEQWI